MVGLLLSHQSRSRDGKGTCLPDLMVVGIDVCATSSAIIVDSDSIVESTSKGGL